jgi:hypothetical protein
MLSQTKRNKTLISGLQNARSSEWPSQFPSAFTRIRSHLSKKGWSMKKTTPVAINLYFYSSS